jgi:hypothetical protein
MNMKNGKSIFRVCVYVNSLFSCQDEGACQCNEFSSNLDLEPELPGLNPEIPLHNQHISFPL